MMGMVGIIERATEVGDGRQGGDVGVSCRLAYNWVGFGSSSREEEH